MATEVGQAQLRLTFDTKSLSDSQRQAEQQITNAGSTSGKAWGNAWTVAAGALIAQGMQKIIATIQNNLSDAIKRVDTMNNFPRVMANLGVAANDSADVVQDLSEKLIGLPTTLDGATAAVQRFTSKNGDVRKSEEIFLAVNDAILAGGMSADIQSTALEQLSQAYAKGKPDMMEWRTLQTAMPAQLKQVATAMIGNTKAIDDYLKKAREYAKKNPMSSTAKELIEQLESVKKGTGDVTTALGTALRTGIISMDEFTDTMIKMDKTGIAGFASLSEQARAATGGIETSLTNLKTAVVRALSNVIQSIGQERINRAIQGLISKINEIGKSIASVVSWLIDNSDVVLRILGIIGSAIAAAFVVDKVISFASAISALAASLAGPAGIIMVIGAAVGAFTLFGETVDTSGKAISKTEKILQESSNSLEANKQKWEELQTAQQEQINTGLSEISYYESLANELKNIVDENGKVQQGYESRAQFITGKLKEALGLEIEYADGVVKGYKKIKDSIADVIASKKAKIILDAQEAAYTEALKKQSEVLREAAKIQEQAAKKNVEAGALYTNYLNALQSGTEEEKRLAQERWMAKQREVEELDIAYNKQLDMNREYAYTIGQYEENMAKFHEGKYNEMSQVTWEYVSKFRDAEEAERSVWQEKVQDSEAYMDTLQRMYEQTGDKRYKTMLESAQKELAQNKEHLSQLESNQREHSNVMVEEWNSGLARSISAIVGKKVEFKEAGDGTIHAYIDGIDSKKEDAKNSGRSIGQAVADAIREKKNESDLAGQSLMEGLKNGINFKKDGVVGTIAGVANSLISTLKQKLEIHSPSRITTEIGQYLDDGLERGILNNQKSVIATAGKLSEKVASAMVGSTSGLTLAGPEGNFVTDHSTVLETAFEAEFTAAQIQDVEEPKQPLNINLELDGQQIQRVFLQDIRRSTI